MNLIFFDDHYRSEFLPLAYTRPISEFRIGITTIRDKWESCLKSDSSNLTEPYLCRKFKVCYNDQNLYLSSRFLPTSELTSLLFDLNKEEYLIHNDDLVAINTSKKLSYPISIDQLNTMSERRVEGDVRSVEKLSDIFSLNDEIIRRDFEAIRNERKSKEIPAGVTIIGDPKDLFLEEGAKILASTINVESGPVYLGKDAQIQEGSLVRGPLALCDRSTLKMGAKIYCATTIGPHSKVGGEVNNSVIFGYSNKAHDGFLGNSVLGEWCNLGADTNTSNLKNNYADVKLWNYQKKGFKSTGLMFCGLIMGDHSKSAINTQFNTGTVIGVCCNIFGAGFPRNYVPSYSWGGAQKMIEYQLKKTFEVAEKVYQRRGVDFDEIEKDILTEVFELTSEFRR